MGVYETVLVVAIIFLLAAWNLPNKGSKFGRGLEEFKKACDQVSEEFHDPMRLQPTLRNERGSSQFILWLAQGFGVGRIPFAPGTFGSLVGLVWFATAADVARYVKTQ